MIFFLNFITLKSLTFEQEKIILKNNFFLFYTSLAQNSWFLFGRKIGKSSVFIFLKRKIFPVLSLFCNFIIQTVIKKFILQMVLPQIWYSSVNVFAFLVVSQYVNSNQFQLAFSHVLKAGSTITFPPPFIRRLALVRFAATSPTLKAAPLIKLYKPVEPLPNPAPSFVDIQEIL